MIQLKHCNRIGSVVILWH